MRDDVTLKEAAEVLLHGGCGTFIPGARAMYEGPLGADEHVFDSPEASNTSDWCRDMLRAGLEGIRDCEELPSGSGRLPEAYYEPGCQRVWYGVDVGGKAWWRIDVIMDGAASASWAVLPEAHAAALAEVRGLLREGCDLLADEHETLKTSITMADGSLSTNPLDAWSVEKVQCMDDWIMRAGRASLAKDSTS